MRRASSFETRTKAVLVVGLLATAACRSLSSPPPSEPAVAATEQGDEGERQVGERPREPQIPDEPEAPVVDQEINTAYGEKGIGHWINRFESEGREVHDQRARVIASLRLKPGMRVADLGAGTGLFTFAMAEAVGRGGHVYAVDIQPHFLDHLRKRAEKIGAGHVTIVKADPRSANLPDGSIDLAFFCDVYHHIEYPRAYLGSLRRALAPGGRLVVIDFERIEGQSPEWLLEHVRAGPDVFRREIENAGFRFVREETFLEENFFYVFELAAS